MKNSKSRAPRFRRSPRLVGGIEVQDRDVEILKLVDDYRLIDSRQLCVLINGSEQTLLRRLTKLYHHRYLDRPLSQTAFSNPVLGPKRMVYALGDRGADLLAERLGLDRGKVKWSKKNSAVKERHIQHTLMISHIRACLNLAIEDTPGNDLIFWVRENTQELRDHVYDTKGARRRRLTIFPDGFFGIKDAEGEMYFFLEADRSTMSNARYRNKVRAYWLWWRQGGARKLLGIENFRVLTVTLSEQRRDNLVRVTREGVGNEGGYVFWFCCVKNIDIEEPATILRQIWMTSVPGDSQNHSILE